MNTKRIFTSIELPGPVKKGLKTIERKDIYWIKWMDPKNFHITMNFLGDLGGEEIETAKQVLAEVAREYTSFNLSVREFRGEQDMLWALPEKNETLIKLQWDLRLRLKNAGVGKRERYSYVPHVLLAKSKTGRRMTWLPKDFDPLEFKVDRINLYESQLTPGVATHSLIESFPLNES